MVMIAGRSAVIVLHFPQAKTPACALSDVTTPFLLLRNIKQQQSAIYMNIIMHRKPMDAALLPNSF